MVWRILIAAAVLAVAPTSICAQSADAPSGGAPGEFGVGVIVGEPTGLSLKYWLDQEQAIDAAAAWSFSGRDSFQFHADYLIHRYDLLEAAGAPDSFPVYYGIGGRIKAKDDGDDTLLGVRIPLGITYLFGDAPFDIFLEVVPVLDLAPDVDLDINAAIGLRFYFR
jgi:hypothetical protein